VVLKLGHFGKWIRNTWKAVNVVWRRLEKISWTDHVRNEEVLRGEEYHKYRQRGEEYHKYRQKGEEYHK
jgi:hypothetical protein